MDAETRHQGKRFIQPLGRVTAPALQAVAEQNWHRTAMKAESIASSLKKAGF